MKNVFFLFAFFIATTLFGQNALLKNELHAAYDFETTEAYAEAKKKRMTSLGSIRFYFF